MDLLPNVFRTEGDMVKFNPEKIFISLKNETGMDEEDAKRITELVVRRIISSNIKFLSGPHIREIVCSVLSEQHFEEARKLYTRIGMPLMDYEEVLEKNPESIGKEILNPEKIHHWAANQLAEEYTLLRILNELESKAHLYGDIHIHHLKYFDLRPVSQLWDPRLILKYGLPPSGAWTHCNKSGPAGDLRVAANHLSKWLGMTQGEFSGTQGFRFVTTFLAPYAKGLSDEEIRQCMQSLVYEINQLAIVIGRDIPVTSLSSSPQIPDIFVDLPAIGPYAKELGKYGDYQAECKKLCDAMTEIYTKGDYFQNPFEFPKHMIYFSEKWIEQVPESYDILFEEVKAMRTPHLINICADSIRNEIDSEIDQSLINEGILQNITLNLPRYAYLSNEEDKFLETLDYHMMLCFGILESKYDIIKKRMNSNHLPLCSGKLNGKMLLDIDQQKLAINFVGLNEAVKFLSGEELHESKSAQEMGKKIIEHMKMLCSETTEKEGRDFVLTDNTSLKVQERFASLDLKHFPDKVFIQSKNQNPSYTNSFHLRVNEGFELSDYISLIGEFHVLIENRACEFFSLDLPQFNTAETFRTFLKNTVCKSSNLMCLKFGL